MAAVPGFYPVDHFGVRVSYGTNSHSEQYAIILTHGDQYEGTGLTPPAVAVWFADGEQIACTDMAEAETVIRGRLALEE